MLVERHWHMREDLQIVQHASIQQLTAVGNKSWHVLSNSAPVNPSHIQMYQHAVPNIQI
jgi:hypothetical protein